MATPPSSPTSLSRAGSSTSFVKKVPTSTKEGWLKKKMQKRYFVIEGHTLSWYDKPLVSLIFIFNWLKERKKIIFKKSCFLRKKQNTNKFWILPFEYFQENPMQ